MSLEAVRYNSQLNLSKDQTDRLELSNLNCFNLTTEFNFDTILFGDMFYDDQFTIDVDQWLFILANLGHTFRVLIGDPGRQFWNENTSLVEKCRPVFQVELADFVKREYPGFHTGTVWQCTESQFLS